MRSPALSTDLVPCPRRAAPGSGSWRGVAAGRAHLLACEPQPSLRPRAAQAPGAESTRARGRQAPVVRRTPAPPTPTPNSPARTLRSANRLWQPPDLSALLSARGRHPAQAPREVAGKSYSELQHDGVGCLQLCLEEGACQRATAAGTGDRPGGTLLFRPFSVRSILVAPPVRSMFG